MMDLDLSYEKRLTINEALAVADNIQNWKGKKTTTIDEDNISDALFIQERVEAVYEGKYNRARVLVRRESLQQKVNYGVSSGSDFVEIKIERAGVPLASYFAFKRWNGGFDQTEPDYARLKEISDRVEAENPKNYKLQ